MLGMMLMGGGTQSTSSSGFSMDMMMMPLMFAFMDKLLSSSSTTQLSNQSSIQTQSVGIRRYQEATKQEEVSSIDLTDASQAVPSGLPVHGRISQGSHQGHIAIDYAIPEGTPIETTMAGKVVYAGWNTQGYGNLVIVENGPYKTYYAHLSQIPVSVGQSVAKGSVIGLSGNTGNSTGPHLHYEVRLNGVQVDPSSYTN